MNTKLLLSAAFGLAILGTAQAAPSNGPSFTAVVDIDGTLQRGLRAVAASRLSQGRYEVQFDGVVNQCGYTATVGLSGDVGSSDPGVATVTPRNGKPKALLVRTFTPHGGNGDRGFHLIVQC